jgi:hypothetical protein
MRGGRNFTSSALPIPIPIPKGKGLTKVMINDKELMMI